MKQKSVVIKSLDDVLNAITSDNVEHFVIDFSEFLRTYVALVDLARAMIDVAGEKHSDKKNTEIMGMPVFKYTNDGKHNHKVIICHKPQGEGGGNEL